MDCRGFITCFAQPAVFFVDPAMNYEGSKKKQVVIFDDLFLLVLEAGLEPARRLNAKGF